MAEDAADGERRRCGRTLAARTNCTCAPAPESTPRYALAREPPQNSRTRFNIIIVVRILYHMRYYNIIYMYISLVQGVFFSSLVRLRPYTHAHIYVCVCTFADPFGPAQYRKCNAPDPFLFEVSTSRYNAFLYSRVQDMC